MKDPITPTAHMVRLAKRWQRQCERLNKQGGGPDVGRWTNLNLRHDDTSHELAEIAAAALVLFGWVPPSSATRRARAKK